MALRSGLICPTAPRQGGILGQVRERMFAPLLNCGVRKQAELLVLTLWAKMDFSDHTQVLFLLTISVLLGVLGMLWRGKAEDW